jgi:hypothetical protein
MGGGLFGTPLYLNPKCLVFSAFVLIVYWMPHAKEYTHKIFINVILAIAAYIILAWYDMIYDCNDRYGPTFFGWLTRWLKQKEYNEQYEELPVKYKKIVRTVDIIILLIMIGLLAYPFIVKSK